MAHVVLLGDSIFDNAKYVPGRPPLVEQLRRNLPHGSHATLLAQDGAMVEDVPRQLQQLPANATHLVLSVGGNDALAAAHLLRESVVSVGEALGVLGRGLHEFAEAYRQLVGTLAARGLPLAICTVYDSIPGLELPDHTALRGFNEIITRTAFATKLPLVDLRLICTHARDYSSVSPIEPSEHGGEKIAFQIAKLVESHDFAGRTAVYC